jgi:predicted RNA-binding Zn ribbon-like protein
VIFSHDTEHSLLCLVDLVNTSPSRSDSEGLPNRDALCEFVRRHEVSEVDDVTDADVEAVRRIRTRLGEVFEASDPKAAAELLNALLSTAPSTPRLTDHDGHNWHVHYFQPGARVADHLAVDGSMALAQVVAAGELDRLRICEAPDCTQVLVDLSRNRSKRYCDARTCGNRLHVAAYRERQRAAAPRASATA